MIVPVLVAVLVPLLFLYLVRQLDLYASGSFTAVIVCFVGGLLAFGGSFAVNTALLQSGFVTWALLPVLFAPIVEELLKSGALIYYVRRRDFTYFVDGAIYGFASGSAFAIAENLLYLYHNAGQDTLLLSVSRAFSTSLMHSSTSALAGVSLGRLKFGHGPVRFLSLVLGWAAAIGLHAAFNNIISGITDSSVLMLAVGIGLGGVALTVGFIFWGLSEERQWLQETLGLHVGVSSAESQIVQRMADMDVLLAPVQERFGQQKRRQVETFLQLQARLGLKSKAAAMAPDPKLRDELLAEVAAMRTQMDAIRRSVGVYCMSYVRSILPPETTPVWDRLGQLLEERSTAAATNLWAHGSLAAAAPAAGAEDTDGDSGEEQQPASGGLWGALGGRLGNGDTGEKR